MTDSKPTPEEIEKAKEPARKAYLAARDFYGHDLPIYAVLASMAPVIAEYARSRADEAVKKAIEAERKAHLGPFWDATDDERDIARRVLQSEGYEDDQELVDSIAAAIHRAVKKRDEAYGFCASRANHRQMIDVEPQMGCWVCRCQGVETRQAGAIKARDEEWCHVVTDGACVGYGPEEVLDSLRQALAFQTDRAVKAEVQAWLDAIDMPILSNHRVKAVGEAIHLAVKAATEKVKAQWARSDDDRRQSIRAEREARERAEKERDDHVDFANEVALGITHSTICSTETPCVRCERDEVRAKLLDVQSAMTTEIGQVRVERDQLQAEVASDNLEIAALRKRVEELEASIKGWISLHAQELEVSGQAIEQARREGAEEMRERAAKIADANCWSGIAMAIRGFSLDPPKAQEVPERQWRGEVCKRCNRRNVAGFSVTDDEWASVSRGRWNVLCLTCFDEEAEASGVRYDLHAALNPLWPVAWWQWSESAQEEKLNEWDLEVAADHAGLGCGREEKPKAQQDGPSDPCGCDAVALCHWCEGREKPKEAVPHPFSFRSWGNSSPPPLSDDGAWAWIKGCGVCGKPEADHMADVAIDCPYCQRGYGCPAVGPDMIDHVAAKWKAPTPSPYDLNAIAADRRERGLS